MDFSSVNTVSLDVGGTLMHPFPSVGAIYAERLGAHGIVLAPERLEAAFGEAYRQAAAEARATVSDKAWWRHLVRRVVVGLHGDTARFDPVFEDLWHAFAEPDRWRLYPGARRTMGVLIERGFRLAVLSNWDERLRPLLDGLGLTGLFAEVVISCEVGLEKPDVGIFRVAEERLGVGGAAIVHVGDSSHHDAGGAAAAGWQWLLIDHQGHLRDHRQRVAGFDDLLARLPEAAP